MKTEVAAEKAAKETKAAIAAATCEQAMDTLRLVITPSYEYEKVSIPCRGTGLTEFKSHFHLLQSKKDHGTLSKTLSL